MSLLDTASLIVTPNGYKEGKLYSVIPSDGSGDLSVTRATTATRVNSSGLVELVPYNLVQYSQEFDNAWWLKYQVSVAANQTTAPDSTLTAESITNTLNSNSAVYKTGITNFGTNTISCYFKKGTYDYVFLDLNGNSYNFCSFNIATGTVEVISGFSNVTIEDAGNGWYRCYATASDTAAVITIGYGTAGSPTAGDVTYIWGAQLVEGSVAKDYQKTETRLNIPRLDYSNGTCPSILVEPQRTNSCINSNTFNASGWNANGIASYTKVANPITGINDATKIVKTTGNSDPYFQQGVGAANGTWTYSMWLWTDSGQPTTAAFYMFNSTVTEFFALPITLTNVPTRYTFTSTFANTGGLIFIRTVLSGADANQYIYAYGGQVEFGSYATSYIPTTSASVTRNADVISKTGISSLIGQTEGTCFVDFNYDNSTAQGNPLLFSMVDTGSINEVYAQILASGGIQVQTYLGGVQQSYLFYGGITNGHHKIAYAYKQNDFVLYVDGVQVATDTSGNVPTTNDFYLGYYNTAFTPSANYNASALWKTRLTNTQLAQLTTI